MVTALKGVGDSAVNVGVGEAIDVFGIDGHVIVFEDHRLNMTTKLTTKTISKIRHDIRFIRNFPILRFVDEKCI